MQGKRAWACFMPLGSAASNYFRERHPMSDFAMLRRRVKYASSPAGISAPRGSSTPVPAPVPSMTTFTSLGWNCGSLNTQIDFVSRIFLRISTRARRARLFLGREGHRTDGVQPVAFLKVLIRIVKDDVGRSFQRRERAFQFLVQGVDSSHQPLFVRFVFLPVRRIRLFELMRDGMDQLAGVHRIEPDVRVSAAVMMMLPVVIPGLLVVMVVSGFLVFVIIVVIVSSLGVFMLVVVICLWPWRVCDHRDDHLGPCFFMLVVMIGFFALSVLMFVVVIALAHLAVIVVPFPQTAFPDL